MSLTAGLAAAASFISTIVLANVLSAHFGLIPIGFGFLVSAGSFAAGLALVARDRLQDYARRWVVFVLIVVGALLSYWFGDGRIALASGIAFLLSELVDMGVYTPIRDRSLALAIIASSVISAPVDTVLFLWISGLGVTGPAVLGQFLVKVAIAVVMAALLGAIRFGGARAVLREPQHARGA